jgi:HEAT repeat protein
MSQDMPGFVFAGLIFIPPTGMSALSPLSYSLLLPEALQCENTGTCVVTPEIVRFQAAQALGAIGPAAQDAVPALREASNDSSLRVRDAAKAALRRITGESPEG